MTRQTLVMATIGVVGLAAILFLMQYMGGTSAAISVIGGLRAAPVPADCQHACVQSCYDAGGDSNQCDPDCMDFCAQAP